MRRFERAETLRDEHTTAVPPQPPFWQESTQAKDALPTLIIGSDVTLTSTILSSRLWTGAGTFFRNTGSTTSLAPSMGNFRAFPRSLPRGEAGKWPQIFGLPAGPAEASCWAAAKVPFSSEEGSHLLAAPSHADNL